MPLEPGDSSPQEAGRGGALLVGQDLGVGEPGRVVDADMDKLPAAGPARGPLNGDLDLAAPIARDAVPGAFGVDLAELLDVELDQLARGAFARSG